MLWRDMPLAVLGPSRRAFGSALLAVASAIAVSLWIAICAAAPEFIWQGLRIAVGHVGSTDLLSALLIGLVLAFFVEPLMERIRERIHHPAPHTPAARPRTALFAALVSIAFALASVCLHHAMTAFLAGHGPGEANARLIAGISLATEWAFVPFAVTLAWLTRSPPWLGIVMAALAAGSSCLAAWLFDWGALSALTTTIPSVLILGLGYRYMRGQAGFARCARMLVIVAAAWLCAALVIEVGSGWFGFGPVEVYPPSTFWEDVRFYVGWAIGLSLAPPPAAHQRGHG